MNILEIFGSESKARSSFTEWIPTHSFLQKAWSRGPRLCLQPSSRTQHGSGVCTNKILRAEWQHSCDKPWMEAVQLTRVGSALRVSHLQSSTRKNWSFANKSKTTITYTSTVLCTDVQELWRKPAYPADVILVIFSFKTDGLLSKPIFRYILIISIPSVQFNYWFTSLLSKISISIYLITVRSEECK